MVFVRKNSDQDNGVNLAPRQNTWDVDNGTDQMKLVLSKWS